MIAIELEDGSQHLDGADAYRRDRRKDALLQEHGYFVLRFLATDVGRVLDTVLDAILRALSRSHRIGQSANAGSVGHVADAASIRVDSSNLERLA